MPGLSQIPTWRPFCPIQRYVRKQNLRQSRRCYTFFSACIPSSVQADLPWANLRRNSTTPPFVGSKDCVSKLSAANERSSRRPGASIQIMEWFPSWIWPFKGPNVSVYRSRAYAEPPGVRWTVHMVPLSPLSSVSVKAELTAQVVVAWYMMHRQRPWYWREYTRRPLKDTMS